MRTRTYLGWIGVLIALSAPTARAEEGSWYATFECGRKVGWSQASTEKLPTGYRRVEQEWVPIEGEPPILFVSRIETDLLGTVVKFSMEHRSRFGVRRIAGALTGDTYRCQIKLLEAPESKRTLKELFVDPGLYTQLLIDNGKATGTVKM